MMVNYGRASQLSVIFHLIYIDIIVGTLNSHTEMYTKPEERLYFTTNVQTIISVKYTVFIASGLKHTVQPVHHVIFIQSLYINWCFWEPARLGKLYP